MKKPHAYLVLELPEAFPDPLRDSKAFELAVEFMLFSLGTVATAHGGKARTLNLAASYRSQGDPIFDALTSEPRPGSML